MLFRSISKNKTHLRGSEEALIAEAIKYKEEHNIKDKPKCKLPKEYKVAIAVKKMKAAK